MNLTLLLNSLITLAIMAFAVLKIVGGLEKFLETDPRSLVSPELF